MFLFSGQNVQLSSQEKYILHKKDCVDYWLTLAALVPTWGSQ